MHALGDRDTLAPPQVERLVLWADDNHRTIASLGLLDLPPTLDSTARPALDTEFEFSGEPPITVTED